MTKEKRTQRETKCARERPSVTESDSARERPRTRARETENDSALSVTLGLSRVHFRSLSVFASLLSSEAPPYERPTSEVGFKPAKWNPNDERVDRRIW